MRLVAGDPADPALNVTCPGDGDAPADMRYTLPIEDVAEMSDTVIPDGDVVEMDGNAPRPAFPIKAIAFWPGCRWSEVGATRADAPRSGLSHLLRIINASVTLTVQLPFMSAWYSW